MSIVEIKNIEPDYIHSSNTVFSFMKKAEYLELALTNRCLSPRYCEENIKYLNLLYEEHPIKTISVLQKCFCDIPLHSITEHFPLKITTDTSILDNEETRELNRGSTHTDFYGEYGIAFSKNWAQKHNLQPVQYINPKSSFAEQFGINFAYICSQENIGDQIVSDIISRLTYFKPLYGEMTRTIGDKTISVLKNFHDECEWRYVPKVEVLDKYNILPVIFDEETQKIANQISNRLADSKYKELWLSFEFEDIRYLIVPNSASRISLINYINGLKTDSIDGIHDKYLLISKILVLSDIKKDF